MPDDFVPGQRWLSDTESDLGLGTVLRLDGRFVHLDFPASGEYRIYVRRSAPLTRVRLAVGDPLEDRLGRCLVVKEVRSDAGLLTYLAADAQGAGEEVLETELSDRLQLSRPQDRLRAARIDPDIWFGLRYRGWTAATEAARSPAFGLVGPRVGLIPHQLYIAAEVASRHAPRVLLADEVGLGKTIEAGLILHRMMLAERVRRVLLVVPEALLHQWLVEMLRRFNLRFALFDAERYATMQDPNPFLQEQQVLCSLDFLDSSPGAAAAVVAGEWDLLVVDEAHHLHWDEEGASSAYDLVQSLARRTPGVLLLTATPQQLGRAGHFARLRLLDPVRFHEYRGFLKEEEAYAPVAALASRLLAGEPLGSAGQTLLDSLLGSRAEEDPAAAVAALVDRHGTGRVLFRNTRAAVKGFPERCLRVYPLPTPAAYASVARGVAGLTPERLCDCDWSGIDPRVSWLADHLRALRPEKVLVICTHEATARELAEILRRREGIHAAVFHEGMDLLERDRAAAYFAASESGTQLLICSEIGSEGRNFQFAHHLVLFDLPLDPDLLEQRIGRLDRIGQTRTVAIHVPCLQGGPAEMLLRWYRDGLQAFNSVCPAAAVVYERLRPALEAALQTGAGGEALVAQATTLTQALNAELEVGRDRLLELHSHRPEVSERMRGLIEGWDRDPALREFLEAFFDAYGVHYEPGQGGGIVLQPGPHMMFERFPGLAPDGASVTFSRVDALAHEDRAFLTWEHPMVRGALDLLAAEDLGGAALSLARHPEFAAGAPLLELLFLLECPAPPGLEVHRFLPRTCLRLVLDAQGRDLSARLAHDALRGQCLAQRRGLAKKLLSTLDRFLRRLFDVGRAQARERSRGLIAAALRHMEREIDAEMERLRSLARVNPNVRPEELEHLEARRVLLARHLGESRVRLDAARVIVMQ